MASKGSCGSDTLCSDEGVEEQAVKNNESMTVISMLKPGTARAFNGDLFFVFTTGILALSQVISIFLLIE